MSYSNLSSVTSEHRFSDDGLLCLAAAAFYAAFSRERRRHFLWLQIRTCASWNRMASERSLRKANRFSLAQTLPGNDMTVKPQRRLHTFAPHPKRAPNSRCHSRLGEANAFLCIASCGNSNVTRSQSLLTSSGLPFDFCQLADPLLRPWPRHRCRQV